MKPAENLALIPITPEGEMIVRHYRDGLSRRIRWENSGILKSIEPISSAVEPDIWIAPALVDLQINGYGGVDLQRDEVTEESLLRMVGTLRRDGCSRILLTLITREWGPLIQNVERYRKLIEANPILRQAIPGWHIEGPFLSDQPGFSGAHNPKYMRDATPSDIQELRRATGNDPVILTVAPERANSMAAIAEAVRLGFVVSLGHTNASEAELQASEKAGARGFTHLGNGCPQLLDRHHNVFWNVLNSEFLTAGIIPDSIHVSPELFRIFHRALPRERIYWTTDAISAAGAPPGKFTIGEVDLVVGEDLVVRNPATNSFAGSALTPIEGIRRGARMLNQNWRDVWDLFSVQPARLMGLPAGLEPESPASFCLLRSA